MCDCSEVERLYNTVSKDSMKPIEAGIWMTRYRGYIYDDDVYSQYVILHYLISRDLSSSSSVQKISRQPCKDDIFIIHVDCGMVSTSGTVYI
jgi:hypothetical protein